VTAYILISTTLALLALAAATRADARGPNLKTRTSEKISATWVCESLLGRPHTHARSPWKPHNQSFRRAQLNLWTLNLARCRHHLHARADALRTGRFDQLPDGDLYALAAQAVASGAIYSQRWGDASPTLKSLCYEAVRRAFARFGTQEWAHYVVNRESGCNPGAVNTTYSDWRKRATCIAQMIPSIHTWVDYSRCKRDLRYAVQVFVRLSVAGRARGRGRYERDQSQGTIVADRCLDIGRDSEQGHGCCSEHRLRA
jgi:hypothetical protein